MIRLGTSSGKVAALCVSVGCSTPVAGDAGAPFCPRTDAVLCADFETSSDPGVGFTGIQMRGAASGSVDMRSLLVTVPANAATTSAWAPYWETMAMLGEADVQFAFRADTLPAILTIAVVIYAQDQYAAAFQIAMSNLYIIEQRAGVTDSPLFVGPIARGEWHAYELVVSPSRRKLEAKIDGVLSSFGMAASQTFKLEGKKTMSVGLVDSSAVLTETRVHFDNIALFSR